MKFARLVEETTVDAAADAVRQAETIGFDRVWLVEGNGADPRMVVGAVNAFGLKIVLQLDAAEDASVPPGLPVELAVAGSAGWSDSLRALLEAAPYEPDPAGWVVAADVGTVATAGRSGVGVAFDPFEQAEEAEEWTSEYEAELSSNSASALGGTVNAATAVFLPTGDDADALIGLVERYREAGVDEVILHGENAGDQEFVSKVIAEFDDEDVRAAADAKRERIAGAIEKLSARAAAAPAEEPDAAAPRKRKTGSMGKRIARFQTDAVQKMSDRQLERLVGNRIGVRFLFKAMASMYRPSKAGDFAGPIEFTLETPHGPEVWTIDCSPAGAKSRRGASPDAKLHVEAGLADFLRIGVGEIAAPSAVLSGKLNIRGDFGLALKMGEMFGGPSVA